MQNKQFILFVSGLDKNVKEADLHKLFAEYPVSYIKIAKDHQTKESFGYAFIGIKNSSSKAEEAINKFNYQKIPGFKKTIKVCWYNMDRTASKHREDLNVFVKKIPKEVTHKDFHDYYSRFGNINSLKIAEDDEGESLGYGFVLFEKVEEADKAISETDGKEFFGKKLWVGKFIKNRPKKPIEFNNLYVKNIPKEYSEDKIKEIFSKYGELGSCLIKSPKTEVDDKMPEEKKLQILNHKFAFICYKKPDSAKKALDEVPFFKLNDTAYNKKLNEVCEKLSKNKKIGDKLSEEHRYRFPVFLIENYKLEEIFNEKDESELENAIAKFNETLKEYDGVYILKDKTDRMECCQALKKTERERKAKLIYEKIKKAIKEKYRFCNLYVKNLPDDFNDTKLREIFEPFGSIKSCKTVKKELVTSYLGIKRSVKVFGYVCFNDKESAHAAKKGLEHKVIGTNKLYVDYHQSKSERNEFLKLNMINKSQKRPGKINDMMNPMGPNIRHMPQMRDFPNNAYNQNMLRKFPGNNMDPNYGMYPGMEMYNMNMNMGMGMPNMGMGMPNMNIMNPNQPISMEMVKNLDSNSKREFYGERLFNKISNSPQFENCKDLFSKIVGIFLDLEESVIERLINDDGYFDLQVRETLRLLAERNSS